MSDALDRLLDVVAVEVAKRLEGDMNRVRMTLGASKTAETAVVVDEIRELLRQNSELRSGNRRLRDALETATVRLDFAANWLQKVPGTDSETARKYAQAAREGLQTEGSTLY